MFVLYVRFLYLKLEKLDVAEDEDDDVVEAHILIDLLSEDGELVLQVLDLHEEICFLLLLLHVAHFDQVEEVLVLPL